MGGTGLCTPGMVFGRTSPRRSSCLATLCGLGLDGEPSPVALVIDNVWADLGRGAGCLRHLRAIAVDHQWKADQTSKDSGERLAADRGAYYVWRKTRMAGDIKTVAALREAALQPA